MVELFIHWLNIECWVLILKSRRLLNISCAEYFFNMQIKENMTVWTNFGSNPKIFWECWQRNHSSKFNILDQKNEPLPTFQHSLTFKKSIWLMFRGINASRAFGPEVTGTIQPRISWTQHSTGCQVKSTSNKLRSLRRLFLINSLFNSTQLN